MNRLLVVAAAAVIAAATGVSTARAADIASEAAQAYTLEATASPSAVKVGEAGKVAVTIRPRTPAWHVHPQAPLKIKLDAPAGLKLDRTDLGRKDVADPKAEAPRFEAPFVATAAGAQPVTANVDFFICSDTACVKQTRSVATAVNVR